MNYAVTAATGHFGQAAVKELNQLVGADQVVVIARNAEKAAQLFPANEVRVADYADQAALKEALAGIDRVLFVSSQPGGEVSRDQQHRNVVAALKAAKVARVVYTSFPPRRPRAKLAGRRPPADRGTDPGKRPGPRLRA